MHFKRPSDFTPRTPETVNQYPPAREIPSSLSRQDDPDLLSDTTPTPSPAATTPLGERALSGTTIQPDTPPPAAAAPDTQAPPADTPQPRLVVTERERLPLPVEWEHCDAPPEYAEISDKLLETFSGKNQEGINTERIAEHLAEQPLPAKPYLLVRPQDLPTLEALDTANLITPEFTEERMEGAYSPELGLSVIVRNPELEALNGPAYTEGLIVHEVLGHSTSQTNMLARDVKSGQYGTVQVGLETRVPGTDSHTFLEEGQADYQRAAYLAKYAHAGTLDKVTKAMGLSHHTQGGNRFTVDGRPTTLPTKYLKVDQHGRLSAITSALAGYAVEQLLTAHPHVGPLLTNARTSLAAQEVLKQSLDQISPGLAGQLGRLQYTVSDFNRGLHIVRNSIR
jgi:hypothetical protein